MAEEEYLNSQGKGGAVYLEQEKNIQPKKELSRELPKIPQPLISTDKNISTGQDPEKAFQDALAQQNRNTIEEATSLLQEHEDDVHGLFPLSANYYDILLFVLGTGHLSQGERRHKEKSLSKKRVPTDRYV